MGRLAKGESKRHCVGSASLRSQALNVSNIYFKNSWSEFHWVYSSKRRASPLALVLCPAVCGDLVRLGFSGLRRLENKDYFSLLG